METRDVLSDAFERVRGIAHRTVEGLDADLLVFRPDDEANSIAWLVWHLTRIQDDHVAGRGRDRTDLDLTGLVRTLRVAVRSVGHWLWALE